MPNALAFLTLASWPLISLVMFRKLPVGRAVIWSLLVSYLFLPPPPTVFDFPAMPPLDKESIPALVAFLICLFMYNKQLILLPKSNVVKVLMVVFVLTPLATVLTNDEPIFFGQVGLPGLRLVEGVALMVQQAMVLMPFILAYSFLKSEADQRDILFAFVVLGAIYSVLMVLEVRLSPQLNLWVYGYYQHYFDQLIRFGGFRPIVFLYHGLWVALFAVMMLAAAAALFRHSQARAKVIYAVFTGYFTFILIICKSVASLGYAAVMVPFILFAGRIWQFRLAAVLGILAVAYPILKGLEYIPEQYMLEQATAIDPDRAGSLQFRFDNERVLLDRALLKPVFGWGSWGRNHILDPVTGRILTVTDGRWIITIGVYGWVGYLAEFVLFSWPLFVLFSRSFVLGREQHVSPYLGALALILGFNLFDLLPNATITSLTWLLSGALLAYTEGSLPTRREAKMNIKTIM
ncbi:hypothetical protein KO498_16225 [Lentibacter algarum]|uniref:hypothetical protein n=1 Tax=Lentibacter algarum TaxID=576131 RepID=UPI001C08869E|nr:hypothetical protein [Lentibacter algarum]MBU2983354.1 hypothetical protein [Lentibacter algarum]